MVHCLTLGWKASYLFLIVLYSCLFATLFRSSERPIPPSNNLFEDSDNYDTNLSHFVRRDGGSSCTKEKPCSNGACCGPFYGTRTGTCGYGETFCGTDCTSNCDAKPTCGKDANPVGKTCPLNVCCSEFGFCESTDQFCDVNFGCQSNCGHPDPPPGKADKSVLKSKVIGYYESWYALKDCHQFPPSAVPVEGLTHVNFAFAYVDPNSYDVGPMSSDTPAELFTQTAVVRTLKSGNGDLEVFVSIGGWIFSDNKTETQPVFGDIASCEYSQAIYPSLTNFSKAPPKRQIFAKNLVKFMQHYGFDGVDIDWEYPGASDRGGKEEDVENYVKLFETPRHTFDASEKGNYGLSFTIPSSYWYLRWFDFKGMMKHADWYVLTDTFTQCFKVDKP